jgi:hypothetical protein
MKDLFISATNKTPEIIFSTNGDLQISGYCIPEDASAFFSPINAWLDLFLRNNPKVITISANLEYINTSSLSQMIRSIKTILTNCRNMSEVNIIWRYDSDDIDALEQGEIFGKIIHHPIQLVSN